MGSRRSGVLWGHFEPCEPARAAYAAPKYSYDLPARREIFCSLFPHLSVLRNTAAHHSRLWNRKFTVTFQLPRKKPAHLWDNFSTDPLHGIGKERKLYNTLVLLIHLIQLIEHQSTWPQRLQTLLQSLDPDLIPDMGFPADWQARPIWQGLMAS